MLVVSCRNSIRYLLDVGKQPSHDRRRSSLDFPRHDKLRRADHQDYHHEDDVLDNLANSGFRCTHRLLPPRFFGWHVPVDSPFKWTAGHEAGPGRCARNCIPLTREFKSLVFRTWIHGLVSHAIHPDPFRFHSSTIAEDKNQDHARLAHSTRCIAQLVLSFLLLTWPCTGTIQIHGEGTRDLARCSHTRPKI